MSKAVLNITAADMRAKAVLASAANVDKTMAQVREACAKAADAGLFETLVKVPASLVTEVSAACAAQGFSVSSGAASFNQRERTVDLIIIW